MIYHIITPNYYESGLFMKVSENAFYELSFENIKILLKHLFGDDMFSTTNYHWTLSLRGRERMLLNTDSSTYG